MKIKSTRTLYLKLLMLSAMLITLMISSGCSSVSPVAQQSVPKVKGHTQKKKMVKVYPDLIKRIIHIKSVEDTTLDFFVFDIHGSMIRYFKMQEKDHEKLSGLERGAYVYQVFQNDIMNSSGKIIIK